MIEIVFFDVGETLLYPHPSFPELFAATCQRHGIEIDAGGVRAVQDRIGSHIVEVAQESGVENPSLSSEASLEFWTYLYKKLLRELGLDEGLAPRLYEVFSDSRSYKLFDDVRPAFDRLDRDGYRLGLISNWEGWLEKMLVELEVGHVFDVSVISGVEGVEKPDPRIYRAALEKAEVEPERAVHVGDSPAMDAEPAAEVGMKVVLLDRHGRHSRGVSAEAPAWPTISSLQELPELLTKL